MALLVLFILAGFAGALLPGGGSWKDDPPQYRIGLLRGLIHYDLMLPLDDELRADFTFSDKGMSSEPMVWLLIGWGSEDFYTSTGTYAEISLATAWQAATGDDAVIRIDRWPDIPLDYQNVSWIHLSQRQYDALRQGILTDLKRDEAGQPLPHPAPGFTGTDSFWQAQGHFSLFSSCNQWVSRQFRAAGIPFGLWTPTPQAVDLSLWWNARPEG